jgi:hypothetical protein
MEGLLRNATQTIDGVAITVTRIYKSIYWVDPIEGESGIYVRGPQDIQLYHTGEKLIVHLLGERLSEVPDHMRLNILHIEDNLGNQFKAEGSGCANDNSIGEHMSRWAAIFGYSPEATSFTLRCDVVSNKEDECDKLLFENVPIDGNGINKAFEDDVITYNGVHWHKRTNLPDSCQIHLFHNKARGVRHVGLSAIADNLGNQYGSTGHGDWGYNDDEGIFFENFKMKPIDQNAKSISFEYLFARKVLNFELRGLPLPS